MSPSSFEPLIGSDGAFGHADMLSTMPEGGEVQGAGEGWRLAMREFFANKVAVAGVVIIVFFVLFCFLGPVFYKTNQSLTLPLNANLPPGAPSPMGGNAGILGTDEHGFDELGRIMLGGQTALEVGFYAAAIATVIGTLYGAVSGLSGRMVDGIMMRIVDVILSIPFLFIVLVLATKYSATVLAESLLLGLFSWLVPARLIRGEVLTLRERDFVWAARMMGSKRRRLVYRHLIPNAMSVVVVNITFLVADSILALAYLGFLGFGLQYPAASWGDMLGNADTYISNGQWWLVYPVAALPRARRDGVQPRRRRAAGRARRAVAPALSASGVVRRSEPPCAGQFPSRGKCSVSARACTRRSSSNASIAVLTVNRSRSQVIVLVASTRVFHASRGERRPSRGSRRAPTTDRPRRSVGRLVLLPHLGRRRRRSGSGRHASRSAERSRRSRGCG